MELAKVVTMIGLLALASVSSAQSPDFEIKSMGSCGSHESWPQDHMTLKRGWDGHVRIRVVFESFCLFDEEFAPSVEYLDGSVRLRVQRKTDEITLHCSCTNKLTFILKRKVPRGTPIVFGFGESEPHLSTIAP